MLVPSEGPNNMSDNLKPLRGMIKTEIKLVIIELIIPSSIIYHNLNTYLTLESYDFP